MLRLGIEGSVASGFIAIGGLVALYALMRKLCGAESLDLREWVKPEPEGDGGNSNRPYSDSCFIQLVSSLLFQSLGK